MPRRPSIRIFGTRDATVQGAVAAFWLVLMLAVVVGGAPALSGFPTLVRALVPADTIAARADSGQASEAVDVALSERFPKSAYASQLLTPLTPGAYPDWLAARIARPRRTP